MGRDCVQVVLGDREINLGGMMKGRLNLMKN
jgi:hypothetical protein